MKNYRHLLMSLGFVGLVLFLTAFGKFLLLPDRKVSGQQSRGWRVWVKTSPCSGRQDWLSVAQRDPTGGGNYFSAYETFFGNQGCTQSEPFGCTFAQATALMGKLRPNNKFFDYCCRDYSVWENTQTGSRSVVLGKFGTAGSNWRFVKGNLCCEEAEAEAGIPGACSGIKGGGRSGWGPHQYGSINQGDGQSLTFYRGTTPEKCQADCDKNPKCVAFTLIRAGASSPNDPPMCYLMSEAKKVTPSNCCITGIKNKSDDKTGVGSTSCWSGEFKGPNIDKDYGGHIRLTPLPDGKHWRLETPAKPGYLKGGLLILRGAVTGNSLKGEWMEESRFIRGLTPSGTFVMTWLPGKTCQAFEGTMNSTKYWEQMYKQ